MTRDSSMVCLYGTLFSVTYASRIADDWMHRQKHELLVNSVCGPGALLGRGFDP
jgi:hypothetical protein